LPAGNRFTAIQYKASLHETQNRENREASDGIVLGRQFPGSTDPAHPKSPFYSRLMRQAV